MSIIPHDGLPVVQVPRIRTRVVCGVEQGASATAVWQQWLEPGSFIPLHYHEVEEVLLITEGSLEVTLDGVSTLVVAPATVIVAAGQLHSMRTVNGGAAQLLAVFPTAKPTILDPEGALRPMPWEDLGTTKEDA